MRTAGVNPLTRIVLVILVVAISYFVTFLLLSTVFMQPSHSMQEMMHGMMSFHKDVLIANLVAISLALVIGVLALLGLAMQPASKRIDEMEILKRALSQDEKAVLDEVQRAGEIHRIL